MLSCDFCEIFKNSFFIEHLQWLLLDTLPGENSIQVLSNEKRGQKQLLKHHCRINKNFQDFKEYS